MTEVSLSQNFDELFIKAERDPPPFCHINLAGQLNGVNRLQSAGQLNGVTCLNFSVILI